jgi:hypothetical protein
MGALHLGDFDQKHGFLTKLSIFAIFRIKTVKTINFDQKA